MTIQYLAAHPGALRLTNTKDEARKLADEFRTKRAIKIYEVREVEFIFPGGRPKGQVAP